MLERFWEHLGGSLLKHTASEGQAYAAMESLIREYSWPPHL